MIPDQDIQKIKSIDIKDFLERSQKFTFEKETEKWYRCNEHNSLIINVKTQFYNWCSKDEKGDIINFVMLNITNNNFIKAVEYLLSYCSDNSKYLNIKNNMNVSKNFDDINKESNLNINYSNTMNRVYAYLCKTRKLQSKIVNEFVKLKLIRQDEKGNIVFFHIYNNKIYGADLNGTSTFKKFKGTVHNSSKNYGFSYKIGNKIEKIYIFEAPIDLLSYYQLFNDVNNALLLSLSGVEKIGIINSYLNNGIDTIIVCTDNDNAGTNALNNIKNKYRELNVIDGRKILKDNNVKDFNELILKQYK